MMTTQELSTTDTLSPPMPEALYCAQCENETHFSFLGVQDWSPSVAKKLGISPRVMLWNCEKCCTTITVSKPIDC